MTLALAVSALCGVGIPHVVDVVTRSSAPHWLKALVAMILAAVAGALNTVTWTAGQRWTSYVLAIATAAVTTMALHATGFSNPTQRATATVGITATRRPRPPVPPAAAPTTPPAA